MEQLGSLCLVVGAVLGACILAFGFLRKLNDCYYAAKLGTNYSRLPPGDRGWPFLGCTLSLYKASRKRDPYSFLEDLVSRHGGGDIYKTHLLGSPGIIVCSAELCRRVLTDDECFRPGYPSSIKILTGKKSLVAVPKAEHKRLRKLSTAPVSGHEALSMYIGCIEHIVVNALDEWASKMLPVKLLDEMKTLTFNIIWNVFMGSGSLGSPPGVMQMLYNDLLHGFISLPINFPGFAFHKALKARKSLVSVLQAMMEKKRLERRNNEKMEARDMMDLLMEVKDEDGQHLADEDIIDLLFGFLLAGHETSAHVGMWAVLFLSDHPVIFHKAKEEQEDIARQRPSTQRGLNLKEIKQMKYLSQVIDETMRLCGIPLMLFREANFDVEINGYVIPKGWRVFCWVRGPHMDPKTYPNPQELNPSRWDNFRPKPGSFIPFGAGSRLCAGSDLAKLELSIFLHYFLLNYRIERVNPKCPITYLPLPRPEDNGLARLLKVS